jgi:hypothetical protein
VTLLGTALIVALAGLIAFFLVMWVRLVFDWARVLQPNWRPRGGALILAEAAYSWSIVMLVCLALIWGVGLFA